MKKTLTRDILLTLFIKFSLLFVLWAVCFKGIEKPRVNTAQWLFGSALQKERS